MDKISSNRSFGILFCIVFAIIAAWPILKGDPLRIWPIPISLTFLVLGLLNSKLLSPLNFVWVKFGELLGRIVAPIVMAVIYFLIVTPIGLFMRIIGKDLLNIKFSRGNSYWTKREKNIGSMKRQF
tara:strand:+ start:8470 stop:8847 length:378 start_codon:yes stop_codon:yes gene_type:complete